MIKHGFRRGFTLIELMVVVAIMAIMAVGATVGFQSLFHYVTVQSAPGYLQTVISQLSTEVSDGDYKKSSVYFKHDYLLVNSIDFQTNAELVYEENGNNCSSGEVELTAKNAGIFYAKSIEGETLGSPSQVQSNDPICIDPLEYKQGEVIYELQTDTDSYNQIRLFPLDPKGNNTGEIYIETNAYRLDILAPYSQKKRYSNNVLLDDGDTATLTIKSTEGEAEVTFDLPKK